MKEIKILNQTRPFPSTLRAGYCSSFFCRLRGLSFRRSIPKDWGLLLVESLESRAGTSIHMLFMFFKIGVVWINQAGQVVDLRLAKPWVSFITPKEPARYMLEIHPARLQDFKLGDQIQFED